MTVPHLVALVEGNMEANFARVGVKFNLQNTNWENEAMLQELSHHLTHFTIDVGERGEDVVLAVSNLRMAVFLLRRVSAHGTGDFEVDEDDREDALLFFGPGIVNEAMNLVLQMHMNLKRFLTRGQVHVHVWRQT